MLCQHEDLSSYPQNTCKKSRVVMLSYNPSTGKVETEGIPETQWPASLAESMSFRFTGGLSQKIKVDINQQKMYNIDLGPPNVHTYEQTHTNK